MMATEPPPYSCDAGPCPNAFFYVNDGFPGGTFGLCRSHQRVFAEMLSELDVILTTHGTSHPPKEQRR